MLYEHDVRLSVYVWNVGGLWSHSATKYGSRHLTGEFGVLATCIPKLNWIVQWSTETRILSTKTSTYIKTWSFALGPFVTAEIPRKPFPRNILERMSATSRACRAREIWRTTRHTEKGQHYTAADRRPTNQVSAWQAGRGSRPRHARHPREETVFAEFKLIVASTELIAVSTSYK